MSFPEKGSDPGSNKKSSPLMDRSQRQSFDLRSLVSNMFQKKGPPTKLTVENSPSSKYVSESREISNSSSHSSTTPMDRKLGKVTTTNDQEKPTSPPAVIPAIKRHADVKGQARSPSLKLSLYRVEKTKPPEKPEIDNYSNSSRTIPPPVKKQHNSTNDKVSQKPTLKSKTLNQIPKSKSKRKNKAMLNSQKEHTSAVSNEKELTSNIYQNNKTKLLHSLKAKEIPIKSTNNDKILNSTPTTFPTNSQDRSLQILANGAEMVRRKKDNIANVDDVDDVLHDSSNVQQILPLDDHTSDKSKSQIPTAHNDQSYTKSPQQLPSINRQKKEKHSIPKDTNKSIPTNVKDKNITLSQPLNKKVESIEKTSKSQIPPKQNNSYVENKNKEMNESIANISSASPSMEKVQIKSFQSNVSSTLEQNNTIDKDDLSSRRQNCSKDTQKSKPSNRKRSRPSDTDKGPILSKDSALDEKESFKTHFNATPDNSCRKSGTGNSGKKISRKSRKLSSPTETIELATQHEQNGIASLGSRPDPSAIETQQIIQRDASSKKSDDRTKTPKKIFDVEFIGQRLSMSKMTDDDIDNIFTQSKYDLNPLRTDQKDTSYSRSKSSKIHLKKTALTSSESSLISSNTVILDLCVAENIPLSILGEIHPSKQEFNSHKQGVKSSKEKGTNKKEPVLENSEKTVAENFNKPHMTNDSSEIDINSVKKSKTLNISHSRSQKDSQDQSHINENYSNPFNSPENNNNQEITNPEISMIEKNDDMSTNANNEKIVVVTIDENLNNSINESLPEKRKRKRNPKYFGKSEERPPNESTLRRSSRKRKSKTVESPTNNEKESSSYLDILPINHDSNKSNSPSIAQKVSNSVNTSTLESDPVRGQDKLDRVPITRSTEKKRNYGPESDRTCPYCKQVFSIITGLAYHVEHKICLHSDQRKIKTIKSLSGTTPFQKLLGGEYFVTKFGVVRVLKDDRAPDDLSSTAIPDKIAALSHNYTRKKERVIKRKESMVMYAAKLSRRRRNSLKEIWLKRNSGCHTQKNIWPLYCKLALPKDILAGIFQRKRDEKIKRKPVSLENHPWLKFGDNPLEPPDSYPHRIVECVLIVDEREQIMDLEYDSQRQDRSSTLTGAAASIKKCLEFQQSSNQPNSSNLHSSGMKLYLRRNTLTNPYNPYIPVYTCYKCGSEFDCRQSLKQHLEALPCERRRVEYLEAAKLRLEEIDKSMNEKNIKPPQRPNRLVPPGEKPKPRIKLKENPNIPGWIKFKPHRSSIYPEVFKFQEFRRGSNNRHFMQKIFEKSGPSRKRQRKSKSKVKNLLLRPMYFEVEKFLFGKPIICTYRQATPRVNSAWTKPDKSRKSFNSVPIKEEDTENFEMATQMASSNSSTTLVTETSEQPTFASSKIKHVNPVDINLNTRLKNDATATIVNNMASPTKQKPKTGGEPDEKSSEKNDKTDTTPTVSTAKKKTRKRSPTVNPKPPGPPVIVDMMVLVEEIDTGRYPSIKRFYGEHSDVCVLCRAGEGNLFRCVFCSNTEHLECVRTKLTIREPEPEDDFMCHRCIQIVLARRSRAEKRRLKKREEWLGKAGIPDPSVATNLENRLMSPTTMLSPANNLPINSAIAMLNPSALNPVVQAAASVERELVWNQSEFDSHVKTYDKCPTGGPGGLICCAPCSASYSLLLTNTAKEMETQTVAKIGREVCELVELLRDAQLRLQQAVDVSNANECRRNLLERNEIETEPSRNRKDSQDNDNAGTII